MTKGAHPSWLSGGNPQQWPFTRLSWLPKEKGAGEKSRFDAAFPNRDRIQYYAFSKAALTSEEILATYTQLLKTDFVSLYAATNSHALSGTTKNETLEKLEEWS